ncbi:MAG: prolyl oligopeptidase family serine peptidase [Balneolaceae bacterium]
MMRKKSSFYFSLVLFLLISSNAFTQPTSLETKVAITTPLQYLLYSPVDIEEKSPLVVFLHGGGEGGTDIEKVKIHGIPKLISEGKKFHFYMIAPQNPYLRGLWDDREVDKLIDEVVNTHNVDPDRIYLVGMSRGGYGVWRMAINNPGKYAAMISVCAASIPSIYTNRVENLPVWFFHGEKDNVVPVEVSINAYNKMKANNQNVKLTLYPEAGHDSWTETFLNDEIYEWLLSKSN